MSNLSDSRPRREARDRDVLVGPREVVALFPGRVARPVRVVEVAAGEDAEVGATRGEDAVDVVVRGDIAHWHGFPDS